MSWDVVILNIDGASLASVEDLQESDCRPLGPAAEVRELISAALADVDWTDPAWGLYAGDGFSIEFNVGNDDPIKNMMLHVRGGGDAISDILKLVGPQNWRALDCSTGEFLDPDSPSSEGWQRFQGYRDKIVGEYGDKKKPSDQ